MERHRLGLSTSRLQRLALVAGPTLFLSVFFVWPVSQLLRRGLSDADSSLLEVFTSDSLRSVAWFTLWQATVSTVVTLVVAMPLTAVLANVAFPGRRVVLALVTIPFVLPTVVVAGAFLATSERIGLDSGPLSLSKSVFAIIVAHVFFNVAVVVRTVGTYWRASSLAKASMRLGPSEFRRSRRSFGSRCVVFAPRFLRQRRSCSSSRSRRSAWF